jgi:hypothetical protein
MWRPSLPAATPGLDEPAAPAAGPSVDCAARSPAGVPGYGFRTDAGYRTVIFEPELHFLRNTEVASPDIADWRRERSPRPLRRAFCLSPIYGERLHSLDVHPTPAATLAAP